MRPICRRRADGLFYSPSPVVRFIVRSALVALAPAANRALPRVLDPACGDGAFLCEVVASMLPRMRPTTDRTRILGHVYGVDTDQAAVGKARDAVAAIALADLPAADRAPYVRRLETRLRWADALVSDQVSGATDQPPPLDWVDAFPEVFSQGGFDLIVGNPPYVNVRWLARSRPLELRDHLKRRFTCAWGAYDLYTLFLEQAYRLLRPGGVCGMIVPNKIATARYALPCRRMLLEQTTLLSVADVTCLKLFGRAGVYPYILIWRKAVAPRDHRVRVCLPETLDALAAERPLHRVRQNALQADAGLQLHGVLDVETRVPTHRLGRRCRLVSGTTGFAAERVAAALRDNGEWPASDEFDFIVSGNIDRYQIRCGDVRFMRRRYRRPRLPIDSAVLSRAKRALYRSAKIVVAGMTRRLEAAWDAGGLALGVQVYAATEFCDEPKFLLGLLNSKLLSFLFRQRFQAKRLAGGYLSVNLAQLAQLPIPVTNGREAGKLARLVERRMRGAQIERIERQIDQAVYRLYDLTDREVERVEREIGAL